MSTAFVNRFIPPDDAPTAVALARLAELLTARLPDFRPQMIGDAGAYRQTAAAGENLIRRAWRAWDAGGRLAAAVSAGRFDTVLSLTDPPFLARRLARRLRPQQFWIEWSMDLYPQALRAAAGLPPLPLPLPPDLLFRPPAGRVPDLLLRLGPGQAAFAAAGDTPRRPSPPTLILPAGVRDPAAGARPAAATDRRIRLVYAGNLGRAHWEDALPLLAAAADPARFHLTVAAYGRGADRTAARLARFPHVERRERPLSDAEMDAADAHVVSLKAGWTHVSAPSKAVSALCRGRPLLFFGRAESDVWGWADGAGRRIDPDRDAAAADLPAALLELAAPARRADFTRRAAAAGERLRTAESTAVDRLAELLTEQKRR